MTSGQANLCYALSAAAAVGVVTVVAYLYRQLTEERTKERPINADIRKEEKKVGDVFDIEDLMKTIEPGKKISLCRCWKSKKWPYCDGAHKQHNQCSGDNVGPVNIVRKKAPDS